MRIPKDLKPGDRLYYTKCRYVTVIEDTGAWPKTVYAKTHYDGQPGYMRYWLKDGVEVRFDTPPIIRIERIAIKPAKAKRGKVDKDITVPRSLLAKIHKQLVAMNTSAAHAASWVEPHADHTTLQRRGKLWFFTDGSGYVYYTPTHWMPLTKPPKDSKS